MPQVSAEVFAESASVVMMNMFSHVDTVFDISISVNICRGEKRDAGPPAV
jgi:hypothetical protein